ncbi:hypothetical protein HAX54_022643, partial [Datura stramonium]|nr:hypothetical protein [Datura stramonium]
DTHRYLEDKRPLSLPLSSLTEMFEWRTLNRHANSSTLFSRRSSLGKVTQLEDEGPSCVCDSRRPIGTRKSKGHSVHPYRVRLKSSSGELSSGM